ncbi:OFA family MFS transporter [Cardiobacteriaceae bacterium TAE3-ERU3]|nr:OFA family MFS transporter [Cardiobacteriaceae bacterium TAE3-ERU3]
MSFLDRSHSIAPPGFNRWLVPPAALAIHLSIGQIYAYSVFNEPMTRVLGVSTSTEADWSLATVGWIFSIALAVLGASAAIFGQWLERAGPRKAMFISACCFGGGFLVSALGLHLHNIWLVYLGNGVLGGIGLGLGYISPVSTLIKWFPDRPGMATGLAIMGFGGGAMLASPLSVALLDHFATPTSVGLVPTFVTLGIFYFVFMMFGMFTVKVPAPDWKPEGYEPKVSNNKLVSDGHVSAKQAVRTPQFWLLFGVLCLNITAGIGVLGQASVMIQEMFSVSSVGENLAVSVAAAAGFVGLLSLFNMGGRFFWSSMSDLLGRKNTYSVFFVFGAILYFLIPTFGESGNLTMFIVGFCLIISMYGGGFATIPAYLRDLFGTFEVGAIHGRILLAWSTAAIIGPVLVNYIRQGQIDSGVAPSDAYSITMYIMAGLLIVGLILNLLVKPVDKKHHIEVNRHQTLDDASEVIHGVSDAVTSAHPARAIISWLIVGVPLVYGVVMVFVKVLDLF